MLMHTLIIWLTFFFNNHMLYLIVVLKELFSYFRMKKKEVYMSLDVLRHKILVQLIFIFNKQLPVFTCKTQELADYQCCLVQTSLSNLKRLKVQKWHLQFSVSPRKCSWLTCGKADESSQNQLTHLSSFAREVDGLETKLSHNRDGNQKSNK